MTDPFPDDPLAHLRRLEDDLIALEQEVRSGESSERGEEARLRARIRELERLLGERERELQIAKARVADVVAAAGREAEFRRLLAASKRSDT